LVVAPGDIRRAVVERAGTLGQIASRTAQSKDRSHSTLKE
jgi:hypothetical protein